MEDHKRRHFLELYEAHHQQLSRFCRAIAGNVEDAQDLMNDTILNTLESFDKIRDKSVFKSYLFSVASNLNKKKLRKLKFRAAFNEAEIRQIIDTAHDPEYFTDFRIVYERIHVLPKKMAEAMILFHIADLSLEDIRTIQGGSISGVKQRLKRGREKLLSLLTTPGQVKVLYMIFTI